MSSLRECFEATFSNLENLRIVFHVHGVLKARILNWFGIPFSSGPHFVRSLHHDHPSWVALQGMAHSFIELHKAVVHVIRLVSFLWLWFSVCLPSDGEGYEAYGSFLMGETDRGKTGSCSDGLSKSLIQFSVEGWGCVPSLLFTQGQTMVEIMKIMGTSFKRSYACTAALTAPSPEAGHHRPTPPPETLGPSWESLDQSLAGSLLLSPGSWCTQGFVCHDQSTAEQAIKPIQRMLEMS